MGVECGILTKPSRGLPPTRWVGECSGDQLGMLASRAPSVRCTEAIELSVADLGIVEHVVAVLVVADFFAQRIDLALQFFGGRPWSQYASCQLPVASCR